MALSAQDLYEIRKIVVSAKLVDSGMFDKDLAKMEAAAKNIQEAQLNTIASENKKSLDAIEKAKKDFEFQQDEINKKFKDLDDRQKMLDNKQADLNKTAAEVGASLDELAAAKKVSQVETTAMYADAKARQDEATKREQELSMREQALAQAQQELNSKLNALKALSS